MSKGLLLQRKNKGRTEEKAAAALVQEVKALGQGRDPLPINFSTKLGYLDIPIPVMRVRHPPLIPATAKVRQ